MTTNITIKPAGHFVLVTTADQYRTPGGLVSSNFSQVVIAPYDKGGAPITIYSTTSRRIEVVDLEPDDDRVHEWLREHRASPFVTGTAQTVTDKPVDDSLGQVQGFVNDLKEVRKQSDY